MHRRIEKLQELVDASRPGSSHSAEQGGVRNLLADISAAWTAFTSEVPLPAGGDGSATTFTKENPGGVLCLLPQPDALSGCQTHNAAQKSWRELEQAGKLLAVVTQNIDGLHQLAGSRKVLELHGSVHRNDCTRCGKGYDARFIL